MARKHSHYFKPVEHLAEVDVYRVLKLFNVTDPCIQHAVKKLLVAGGRGDKAAMGQTIEKDVAEAIITLQRWQEMQVEDAEKPEPLVPPTSYVVTKLMADVEVSDTLLRPASPAELAPCRCGVRKGSSICNSPVDGPGPGHYCVGKAGTTGGR